MDKNNTRHLKGLFNGLVYIVCVLVGVYLWKRLNTDETTIYYLFSTIAQVVAALFGLLGAVVLFRIQNLDREICDNRAWILGWLDRWWKYSIPISTPFSGVISLVREKLASIGDGNSCDKVNAINCVAFLEGGVSQRKRLLDSLKWAAYPSLVVITISFVALGLTNFLQERGWGTEACLMGIILGTVAVWFDVSIIKPIIEFNLHIDEDKDETE
ncbi:MAG: hypothetical protein PHT12_02415 [Patescibacteria group bacterium]|nr:hypothetical protein [Patescibacteria group bacterium]